MQVKWAQELAGFASCNFAEGAADGDGGDPGAGGGDDPKGGGGDRGGGSDAPQDVPWSRDKRFREDYAALQEYKKEKPAYSDWKAKKADHDRIRQEHALYEGGEHPKFKEAVQQKFNEGFYDADAKWQQLLQGDPLVWDRVQALLRGGAAAKPEAAPKKDEPEKEYLTREEARKEAAAVAREERRVERIQDTIADLVSKSPLSAVEDFGEFVQFKVHALMRKEYREDMTEAQLDALARRTPEFVQAAEAAWRKGHEALSKKDAEDFKAKEAAKRPDPSVPGGRMPPGMDPAKYRQLQRQELIRRAQAEGR